MVIIWGVTRAGKVDIAPGLFHVESSFGHVYYIPMIPLQSVMVLQPQLGGGEVAVPMSFKSILFGWIRGASIIAFGGFLIAGFIQFVDRRPDPATGVICLGIAIVALAILIASYMVKPLTSATYERAISLARAANFTPMGLLAVEVAYGRMDSAQADAYLARLDEEESRAAPTPATSPSPPK